SSLLSSSTRSINSARRFRSRSSIGAGWLSRSEMDVVSLGVGAGTADPRANLGEVPPCSGERRYRVVESRRGLEQAASATRERAAGSNHRTKHRRSERRGPINIAKTGHDDDGWG